MTKNKVISEISLVLVGYRKILFKYRQTCFYKKHCLKVTFKGIRQLVCTFPSYILQISNQFPFTSIHVLPWTRQTGECTST